MATKILKKFLTDNSHFLDELDFIGFFEAWYQNSTNLIFDLHDFSELVDELDKCDLGELIADSLDDQRAVFEKHVREELDNLCNNTLFYNGLRVATEHILSGLKSTIGLSFGKAFDIIEEIAVKEYNAEATKNFRGERALIFH